MYKKGESGNPKGRTPGRTEGETLRKQVAKDLPAILETVVKLAIGGDVQASKLLFDKVWANVRPQALPVTIPIGATLPQTGNNVVTATLTGAIPPDIGSMLIRALADQGKLIELLELTKRIEALENNVAK